tara:strand:+ start:580 stop:795 length:216 start_codon:yes stop_codon:yes gene_type:complete
MRIISTEKFARNFGHGGAYDQSPHEGRDSVEQGSLFYDNAVSEDDIIERWKPKKKKHKKKKKIEKFPEKAL